MRIIADTNVLLRFVLADDHRQQDVAAATLQTADTVAISAHALCELAWVMSKLYGASKADIAEAIDLLAAMTNVVVDQPAVKAGLAFLKAGGDFADGIIAFDGGRLGGEVFVSFDRKAVSLAQSQGRPTKLLT